MTLWWKFGIRLAFQRPVWLVHRLNGWSAHSHSSHYQSNKVLDSYTQPGPWLRMAKRWTDALNNSMRSSHRIPCPSRRCEPHQKFTFILFNGGGKKFIQQQADNCIKALPKRVEELKNSAIFFFWLIEKLSGDKKWYKTARVHCGCEWFAVHALVIDTFPTATNDNLAPDSNTVGRSTLFKQCRPLASVESTHTNGRGIIAPAIRFNVRVCMCVRCLFFAAKRTRHPRTLELSGGATGGG